MHERRNAMQRAVALLGERAGGILGEALAANHRGRLSTFIVDETSPAIAIFEPARARANHAGDWYGEHAGKWLYAAAKAAARTGDATLLAACPTRRRLPRRACRTADGYLGNYAPERRFMRKQPPKPVSWDGAPSIAHLGHLDAQLPDPRACSRCIDMFGNDAYLEAACRIGDLCWRTLTSGGIDITDLGNHHGMSATVLMDPALELHFATGEQRYPRSRAAHPGAGGAQSAPGAADAGARRRGCFGDRDRQGVSAALESGRRSRSCIARRAMRTYLRRGRRTCGGTFATIT